MAQALRKIQRVLGVDPVRNGFGYAVIEDNPLTLVDWGVFNCKEDELRKCLKRIDFLIERYQPTAVALEKKPNRPTHKRKRVVLIEGVLTASKRKDIAVQSFEREQIRQYFSEFGAITKEEIAKRIAEQFPELFPRLPKHREPYMSEDYRMNIFDAVALVLTFLNCNKNQSPL